MQYSVVVYTYNKRMENVSSMNEFPNKLPKQRLRRRLSTVLVCFLQNYLSTYI